MKKKIFIITGMILCILAGIVIVPSVIRTRKAVKEFEKDFHASANSGADSAGIDSEDEPAAENEEASEEEEKKATIRKGSNSQLMQLGGFVRLLHVLLLIKLVPSAFQFTW